MASLEKLAKVNDSYTVTMCENGFMVEIGGRDVQDEWVTIKVICSDMAELTNLIETATQIPRS